MHLCCCVLPRFNTQPPEGGWINHSHCLIRYHSFNTQPPEGGWRLASIVRTAVYSFNTQPPEGGWAVVIVDDGDFFVSTHSRLKAAGIAVLLII